MTEPPTSNESNYRYLSIRQLNEWSDEGSIQKNKLLSILKAICLDLRRSKSPSKVVKLALVRIENFFSSVAVQGGVVATNSRRIDCNFCVPIRIDNGLAFTYLNTQIIARAGRLEMQEITPIKISLHAMERLLQRVDKSSDLKILEEIYSCIQIADVWKTAAINTGSLCWPLISKSGFFVAAEENGAETATLITWMRGESLSPKWKSVFDKLLEIRKTHESLLSSLSYVEAFLRLFPWLQQQHAPGEGQELSEGAAREEVSFTQMGSFDNATGTGLPDGHGDSKRLSIKLSKSYVIGLNYCVVQPDLKPRTRSQGMVIARADSGSFYLSLPGGYIGKFSSYHRMRELAAGLHREVQLGETVNVFIRGIFLIPSESAWLISLDIADLADFEWNALKTKFPLGYPCVGTISANYGLDAGCNIKIEKYVHGVMPTSQIYWFYKNILRASFTNDCILGEEVAVQVVGYDELSRRLLFDLEPFRAGYFINLLESFVIGEVVDAKVIRTTENRIFVSLKDGFTAWIRRVNCWDRPISSDLSDLEVKVFALSKETNSISIGLLPPSDILEYRYAEDMTDCRWLRFNSEHVVGDQVLVQIIATLVGQYACSLEDGTLGYLAFAEIDWLGNSEECKNLLKLGDFVLVEILKIGKTRSISLSRKKLQRHPLETMALSIGDVFIGVMKLQKDFGFFILLPFGFSGLLHNSVLPNHFCLDVGDSIPVQLIDIDIPRRRISLGLCDETKFTNAL
jgi:ribosomal protein S1